ncbi:MAG: cupredoxin domain-containing protein [Spirosomaceae bacterium]|jgi:hypothetical protein|nr:cupredoxin domain-containing protein [Spirosomataceae bacterium]
MKTAFVLAFSLFVSSLAVANDDKTTNNPEAPLRVASFPVENGYFLKVHIEKPANQRIEVKMQDELNRTVMSEVINRGYSIVHLKLDISELKAGQYTLSLKQGDKVTLKNVTIGEVPSSRMVNVALVQ